MNWKEDGTMLANASQQAGSDPGIAVNPGAEEMELCDDTQYSVRIDTVHGGM